MILVAAIAIALQGQAPNPPSGAQIVSNMFKHYAGAKSLVGRIHLTQTAQGKSVTLDTEIAYEVPSKLYLSQVLHSSEPRSWLVTSDGVSFTYDYPNDKRFQTSRPEPGRLEEAVTPPGGQRQNYQQIFRASTFSLGELQIPEFLAIGGTDCLQAIKDQLATIAFSGTTKMDNKEVSILSGDWRYDTKHRASGKYQMFVTADGDLKRFTEQEMVALTQPGQQAAPVTVSSVWDVDLQVNAKPDESVFKVVK